MLNISAAFLSWRAEFPRDGCDVLWFTMAIPALSHQGKYEKYWSEKESIPLIKSVSVLFISSSVSLFIQPHIRLSKGFPCHKLKSSLIFHLLLPFLHGDPTDQAGVTQGCDNLCRVLVSPLLGKAAPFMSLPCRKRQAAPRWWWKTGKKNTFFAKGIKKHYYRALKLSV